MRAGLLASVVVGVGVLVIYTALATPWHGSDQEVETTFAGASPVASTGAVEPLSPSSMGDRDGDGVPELTDNCPGIPNPDQSDLDRGITVDGESYEAGDACDDDIDGDGLTNETDPHPLDTDNDGTDNQADPDDDDDGVADSEDKCVLIADPGQEDADGDGYGDACDLDDDDDGFPDPLEQFAGSDANNPASQPEFLGRDNVCADGLDNDLDGQIDDLDETCADADGDGHPDSLDNCPEIANGDQLDRDNDGLGAACDPGDGGG